MRVSALSALVIAVHFPRCRRGRDRGRGPRPAGGPAGRHCAQRLPVSRRPQGGGERAGELAGADAVCQSTAEQARGPQRAGDPAGLVRVALGGDPPRAAIGVDLDRQCPTSARAEEVVITTLDNRGTASSWWNNLAAAKRAIKPTVSTDDKTGTTYVYNLDTPTCGVVISVSGGKTAADCDVPAVRCLVADTWKKMDLEIEWGFDRGHRRQGL